MAIKFVKEGILLTGKEKDEVKLLHNMFECALKDLSELTGNSVEDFKTLYELKCQSNLVADTIKAKEEGKLKLSKDIVNDEYTMPSLNVEVLLNTKSILDRVNTDNHYLNFANKNCTDKEKKKLLDKFLNKIGRPDLLDSLCETSNTDIIINILAEMFNMKSPIEVMSTLDNVNNFIGFKNFMLFILDFINYEDKCNHMGLGNPMISHIDEFGKCDMCGKTISHDSLMIAKMLELI